MKRTVIKPIIVLTTLLALAACTSAPEDNLTPSPVGDDDPTATVPLPATEAYPAMPTVDAEYPAPVALPTAYPADMELWMVRPLGEQCVDPETYTYAHLDEAVEALEDAGVDVLAAEETARPVCAACDCPTSEHFRVRIRAQDLAVAEDLGWFRE